MFNVSDPGSCATSSLTDYLPGAVTKRLPSVARLVMSGLFAVPHVDPSLAKALGEGDVERVAREKKDGPELSIFQFRDHGAMLKIAGKARNALQYDIGNPVTASLMTRHRLAAALYAPIRVQPCFGEATASRRRHRPQARRRLPSR